jgi:hypothetical protein
MLRLASYSLIALLLYATVASAAPAPVPKPTPKLDAEAVLAQLGQHVLREYGAHADNIEITGNGDEWEVIGNTPVLTHDGRTLYERRLYRVSLVSVDRRGNARFEATVISYRPRLVITR